MFSRNNKNSISNESLFNNNDNPSLVNSPPPKAHQFENYFQQHQHQDGNHNNFSNPPPPPTAARRENEIPLSEKSFIGPYASNMEFYTFCNEVLEPIRNPHHNPSSSHTKAAPQTAKEILTKLFEDISNFDRSVHNLKWADFFSFMRLLCPEIDKERNTPHLDERKLGAIYLELLALSKKESPESRIVENWKGNNFEHFSEAIVNVLTSRGMQMRRNDSALFDSWRLGQPLFRTRQREESGNSNISSNQQYEQQQDPLRGIKLHFPLLNVNPPNCSLYPSYFAKNNRASCYTVIDANNDIDRIFTSGPNVADKKEVFKRIISNPNITVLEHRWIVRIVLQKMAMHFSHKSILSVFHPNANEHYNMSYDLRTSCILMQKYNDNAAVGDFGNRDGGGGRNGIGLFTPFAPMLAGLCDTEQMTDLLKNKKYVAEAKYDGERVLVHIGFNKVAGSHFSSNSLFGQESNSNNDNNNTNTAAGSARVTKFINNNNQLQQQQQQQQVLEMRSKYLTRKAKGYSDSYGAKFDEIIRNQLNLTAIEISKEIDHQAKELKVKVVVPAATTCSGNNIHHHEGNSNHNNNPFRQNQNQNVSHTPNTNVILDGEFVVYDSEAKAYLAFGQNRGFGADRTTNSSDILNNNSRFWYCYQIFDVVFLNGQSLIELPLRRRKEILKHIIIPKPHMVEVNMGTPVGSVRDAFEQLEHETQNGNEGIVLKNLDSSYEIGARKFSWLKLKADNIDGLCDTVDAVILGGFIGTKFRSLHNNNNNNNNFNGNYHRRNNNNNNSDNNGDDENDGDDDGGLSRITHFLIGVWAGGKNEDGSFATSVTIENHSDSGRSFTVNNVPPSPSHRNAKFITIGKVGSGYTNTELESIKARLHNNWETFENFTSNNNRNNNNNDPGKIILRREFDKSDGLSMVLETTTNLNRNFNNNNNQNKQQHLDTKTLVKERLAGLKPLPSYLVDWKPKSDKDIPDFFIRDPSQSVVVTVGGFCFVKTDKFALGETLRFPKCVGIDHFNNNAGASSSSIADATDFIQLTKIIKTTDFQQKLNALFRQDGSIINDDGAGGHISILPKIITSRKRRNELYLQNSNNNAGGIQKQKNAISNTVGLPWAGGACGAAAVSSAGLGVRHNVIGVARDLKKIDEGNRTRRQKGGVFQGKQFMIVSFNSDGVLSTNLDNNSNEANNSTALLFNWKNKDDACESLQRVGGATQSLHECHIGKYKEIDYYFANSAIAAKKNQSVANYMREMSEKPGLQVQKLEVDGHRTLDILSLDWAKRCMAKGELMPPFPHEYIFVSNRTKEQLARDFDEFNDGYVAEATVATLKKSMELSQKRIFYVEQKQQQQQQRQPSLLLKSINDNPDKALAEARRKFEELCQE